MDYSSSVSCFFFSFCVGHVGDWNDSQQGSRTEGTEGRAMGRNPGLEERLAKKKETWDREDWKHTTSVLIDFSSADERHYAGLKWKDFFQGLQLIPEMRGTDRSQKVRLEKKGGEKREELFIGEIQNKARKSAKQTNTCSPIEWGKKKKKWRRRNYHYSPI